MNEKWKAIEGYEGRYEISNLGKVKSLPKRKGKGRGYIRPTQMMTLAKDKNGYYVIGLRKYRQKKCLLKVHRLVAKAFIPNPENKPQINHKNGVKDDNKVGNLEWVTSGENCRHAYKTGLQQKRKGEQSGFSKLKEYQVRKIRQIYKEGNITQKELGKVFGICQAQIWRIIHKKRWSHI